MPFFLTEAMKEVTTKRDENGLRGSFCDVKSCLLPSVDYQFPFNDSENGDCKCVIQTKVFQCCLVNGIKTVGMKWEFTLYTFYPFLYFGFFPTTTELTSNLLRRRFCKTQKESRQQDLPYRECGSHYLYGKKTFQVLDDIYVYIFSWMYYDSFL